MSLINCRVFIVLHILICNAFIYSQNTKIDLIQKFAQKNIAWAQYELSNLYYEGKTIEKNDDLSFEYMLKSAKQGYNKASYGLGVFYNTGVGCKISKVNALAWMMKSYDSGYLRAQDYIDQLHLELASQDIELAQNTLKRHMTINISPKWVYIKSKDNKIKTNSKGESKVTLEAFLYSKKQISFSKSGYITQNINVEFGKDKIVSINLSPSVDVLDQSVDNSVSVTNVQSSTTNWIYY